MRGEGGGVGVSDGKKGLRVCKMKAPSVLLGVKGIIMQTTVQKRARHMKKRYKETKKKQQINV